MIENWTNWSVELETEDKIFPRIALLRFSFDRYCNSRVVKFNAAGEYQGQFGDEDFYTPHSLALAEELDIICVADRDNRR